LENGQEHVKPAVGDAGEIFVGFSWMHNVMPSVLSKVELVVVPKVAPFTFQLSRQNIISGQISGSNKGTFYEEGTVAAHIFDCEESTGILTFDPSDAEKRIEMVYKYSPSVLEAKANYADADININPAFAFLGSIGCILTGEIFTDQFDASVDWSAKRGEVYLGTGLLTGSGATKLGAHVTHVPTADNPFLGVQFSNH
jgi:hypothetical protein